MAYQESPFDSSSGNIFVAPSQDGVPQILVDDGFIADWTRDGRYLAVIRHGALFLIPIKDGGRAGDPVLLRQGNYLRGQSYANGMLGLDSPKLDGAFEPWLATLNPDGKLGHWKRLHLSGSGGRTTQWLTWSPASNEIAYVGVYGDTVPGDKIESAVRVRSIGTGSDREAYHFLAGYPRCFWGLEQTKLYCQHCCPKHDRDAPRFAASKELEGLESGLFG